MRRSSAPSSPIVSEAQLGGSDSLGIRHQVGPQPTGSSLTPGERFCPASVPHLNDRLVPPDDDRALARCDPLLALDGNGQVLALEDAASPGVGLAVGIAGVGALRDAAKVNDRAAGVRAGLHSYTF